MAKMGIMSFAHMHAYSYAACLNELPEAEFVAVWDDDAGRGAAAASQFGTTFIADLEEFLGSGIDGVIVTSENVKHRAMVERAAAAGKWILCEKPLATTPADCQAMIKACADAKVGLGTAFPCRYIQSLLAVKQQIDNGDFGAIYAASCTNNGQFPGGWFAQMDLAGGGATMDHTVHVADVLRWMLGKEFTKVYCENGHLLGRDTDLDDAGCLQMEMEGGVIISHIASWNRAKSFPTWGDVTLELIGEKGVVYIDSFNQKLNVYNDDAMKTEWAFWGDNPDLGLVADFVAAVDEKREPSVTGVDGMRALEVTVAAYKAAAEGRTAAVQRAAC
ncbi:MAG: Gfo/Idh/MocA family oxidoreductase [Candidatus Hydrogenedentes bacterium]|nr:Gfo/Idh/MocA family oxidoreductase [Candidatus Hydrogenedentota bacterium]